MLWPNISCTGRLGGCISSDVIWGIEATQFIGIRQIDTDKEMIRSSIVIALYRGGDYLARKNFGYIRSFIWQYITRRVARAESASLFMTRGCFSDTGPCAKIGYVPIPTNCVTRDVSFLWMLWPGISRVGYIFGCWSGGISLKKFIGVGHVSSKIQQQLQTPSPIHRLDYLKLA